LQVAATLLLDACFHLSLQRKRVHYSVAFPFLRTWEPQILAQFQAFGGLGEPPDTCITKNE